MDAKFKFRNDQELTEEVFWKKLNQYIQDNQNTQEYDFSNSIFPPIRAETGAENPAFSSLKKEISSEKLQYINKDEFSDFAKNYSYNDEKYNTQKNTLFRFIQALLDKFSDNILALKELKDTEKKHTEEKIREQLEKSNEILVFDKPADFSHSTFTGDTNFNKDERGPVRKYVVFQGPAKFNHVEFRGETTSFFGLHSYHNMVFDNAVFYNKANFNEIQFKALVTFKSVRFKRETYFRETQFKQGADFSAVRFH
ncbi:MAG: pentapeptide repeat-containing protein, partial [Pseudomonadota bacterium]